MIDSHAHLTLCEEEPADLVARSREAGVRRILTVGLDEESNRAAIALATEHEEVRAAVGRHPNGAAGFDSDAAADIEELASDDRVAAVGETGLDFYRDRAPRSEQEAAFRAQIAIARQVGKPLVIHMRESIEETFSLLDAEADGVTVILHCFSGTADDADVAAERGWSCSFAGNLTYPKADGLRETARRIPDELLLVETDSPFLAPQPMRGKPNQPANVVATAKRLAEVRGSGFEELERLVEENAARVLGW